MANAYTLSMSNITINKIAIAVTGKSSEILASGVKIKKYNAGVFENFTTFTLEAGATASSATIVPNTAFNTTDLLIVQIDDGTDKSDKVMVDFQENYADHDAEYKFELPTTSGSYTMQLDKVNDMDFSSVKSATFDVGNSPDTANSSVSIPKDYLVHFTGSILDVTVTLDNASNDAAEGNYEVSLSADLQ